MIDSRRINDTVLVNAIIEMMSRKTPEIFAAQVRALLARPDAGAGAGTNPLSRVAPHWSRGWMEHTRAARRDGGQDRRQPNSDCA